MTEDLVRKLADYEASDLPERTKAALRLAEVVRSQGGAVDRALYDQLREHFSDEQVLDLGMCAAFLSGWQRFVEAFGVVPDRWADGDPLPWEAILDDGDEVPPEAATGASAPPGRTASAGPAASSPASSAEAPPSSTAEEADHRS